ncbi:MAG: cation diffusion facilitator family transporter [Ignavibacteria bacterium]|nr:cation diffusion facilitator family transporter [Ignavibacteria bacterium]
MESSTESINRKKIGVANISLYAALFIVFIKLFASLISGSIGVLSELFHSSTDLIATIATILSIRYSTKPPDSDHHYGHDKIESFSALFQVVILVFMCAYLIYESIDRIIHPIDIHLNVFVFLAILICIFIDYHRSKALMKVAKETKSQALEADALHFSSDIYSSLVVLAGMIFTSFKISNLADPISAIVVSIIIIYTTLSLSKKAIGSLLDRVPDGIEADIRKRISDIKGIEGIRTLRIRGSSTKTFVDMVIQIGRTKSFSMTHELMDTAEKSIKEIADNIDVVIHSEPVETSSETLNEKIRMIVNDSGFKCHDIFSHRIDKDIFSELHVEIENTNDLIKAHDVISDLEDKILEKIPIVKKVKIHLDEPSEILFDTIDITEMSSDLIANIHKILSAEDKIEDYGDIRVMNSAGKIRVSLNCSFKSEYTFDEVHDVVTILESRIYLHIKEIYPNLSNVIIHAEPK